MQYNAIQYNTMQCHTIQNNTIQGNAIQYNAMQCNIECLKVKSSIPDYSGRDSIKRSSWPCVPLLSYGNILITEKYRPAYLFLIPENDP